MLKDYLLKLSAIGFCVSRTSVPLIAKDIFDEASQKTNFKDNLPSVKWVYRFFSKNPELTTGQPDYMNFQNRDVNQRVIRDWFTNLMDYLHLNHGINAEEFLVEQNGCRIFNLNEFGIPLYDNCRKQNIITAKDLKLMYKNNPNNGELITIFTCISANGIYYNPCAIFPQRDNRFNQLEFFPDNFDQDQSINGSATSDNFYNWLSKIFFCTVEHRVQFPIIIFMHGHTNLINKSVLQFCKEKQIILYCFPPQLSPIINPTDVTIFSHLEEFWLQSMEKFYEVSRNASFDKRCFFSIFDEVWIRVKNIPGLVKEGFQRAGLVPFDPDIIDFNKIKNTIM